MRSHWPMWLDRRFIREQAETLLASIRGLFRPQQKDPASIIVTRTELTRAYALHPGRRTGLTVDELYGHVVPQLIKSGEAVLLLKKRKKNLRFPRRKMLTGKNQRAALRALRDRNSGSEC